MLQSPRLSVMHPDFYQLHICAHKSAVAGKETADCAYKTELMFTVLEVSHQPTGWKPVQGHKNDVSHLQHDGQMQLRMS